MHKISLMLAQPLRVALILALPLAASADSLSQLPQPWQEMIQPIAEADLSGAEPQTQKAIQDQRHEVARLLTDQGISNTDLAEGYGRLGALYQLFQVDSAAMGSYRNAMTLDPANVRWAYYAAYHASRTGRPEEALRLYGIAKQLQPDYPPLPLRMGETQLELNRLDEASSSLNAVVDIPGLRAPALYQLAQIDLLQRDYDGAIAKLEEVLRLAPEAKRAHYPLAQALRAKGENQLARQHLASQGSGLPKAEDRMIEELEALNQGARRYFNQAMQASQNQEFKAAAKAFAKGLEIEPDNHNARISYARALYLSGDRAAAATELRKVLDQQPEQALARFLNAILLEGNGEHDQAMQDYRRVLEQEPEHYGAHYCLANRLYQTGSYQEAAAHYRAALQSNPEIPPARLYELLARRLSGAEDAEILKALNSLTATHPQDRLLSYTLIRLLLLSDAPQARDFERARQLANELVQQAFIPPHVELQALVAASLGHFEQAAMLQRQILPSLQWLGPESRQEANEVLSAYERKEMPQAVWYRDNRMLQAPVTDARLMFREYPAAVPF